MVFSWRNGSEECVEERTQPLRPAAGKVTRTRALLRRAAAEAPERAAAPAPSLRLSAMPDPFDFSSQDDRAVAGFSGTPSAFPHRAEIERSFGRSIPHTAYSDEQAARACSALGAQGYAYGDQVAFATSSPSLELAAHEAAHVLQASSGVELYGGTSDYEAHADLAAARVVRGESAADLFGGPTAATAVRRQTMDGGVCSSSSSSSSSSSADATPAAGPSHAAATAQQRMSRAISAGDLAQVLALQRELMQQLGAGAREAPARGRAAAAPSQSQHAPASSQSQGQPGQAPQPEDARAAIVLARHYMMEQIAAVRARLAPQLEQHATTGAASSSGPMCTEPAASEQVCRAPSSSSSGPMSSASPNASSSSSSSSSSGPMSSASPNASYSSSSGPMSSASPNASYSSSSSGPMGSSDSTSAATPAASTAAGPRTSEREAVEVEMDRQCTPYLDGLLQGDPTARYSHPRPEIERSVFSAVRLHAVRRGVGRIGHRDEAEREARDHGGVRTEAWCGAFAFTQAEQGGGFDRRWASNMAGESGIREALAYRGSMARTWVWTGSQWMRLREYHEQRGALRWYEEVHRGPPSRGISAGDLVLIDNSFGTNPDHITTAISFDGRYLTTVGGNQGSGEAGVSRSRAPFDLLENPEPNDVRRVVNGQRVREADPHQHKHVRVHGIGRWSLVDYERRHYQLSDSQPTAPPTEAAAAR